MYNIIEKYIKKMTKEDISKFAKTKNINLNEDELSFTYNFIKKNYKDVLLNSNLFDINRIKNKYSDNNFIKIKKVYMEYFSKYQRFL